MREQQACFGFPFLFLIRLFFPFARRKKIKTPSDLCKLISAEAKTVEGQAADKRDKKALDTIGTGLALCKIYLYGDEGQVGR